MADGGGGGGGGGGASDFHFQKAFDESSKLLATTLSLKEVEAHPEVEHEIRVLIAARKTIDDTIQKARAGLAAAESGDARSTRGGLEGATKKFEKILAEQGTLRSNNQRKLILAERKREPASDKIMRDVSDLQDFVDKMVDIEAYGKDDLVRLECLQVNLLKISHKLRHVEMEADRLLRISAYLSKFMWKKAQVVGCLSDHLHLLASTKHTHDPIIIGLVVDVAKRWYMLVASHEGEDMQDKFDHFSRDNVDPIHFACMISRVAREPEVQARPKFMSYFGDAILRAISREDPDLRIAACSQLLQIEGYKPTAFVIHQLDLLYTNYRMLPRWRVLVVGGFSPADAGSAEKLAALNAELAKLTHTTIDKPVEGTDEYGWHLYHLDALNDGYFRREDELPVLGPVQRAFLEAADLKESTAIEAEREDILASSKKAYDIVAEYMKSGRDAERVHVGPQHGVFYGAPLFVRPHKGLPRHPVCSQLAYARPTEIQALLRIYAYLCLHFVVSDDVAREAMAHTHRQFTDTLFHILRRLPFNFVHNPAAHTGFEMHAIIQFIQTVDALPAYSAALRAVVLPPAPATLTDILSKVMTLHAVEELKRRAWRLTFSSVDSSHTGAGLNYDNVLTLFKVGIVPSRQVKIVSSMTPATISGLASRNHPAGLMKFATCTKLQPFDHGNHDEWVKWYAFFYFCCGNMAPDEIEPSVALDYVSALLEQMMYGIHSMPPRFTHRVVLEGLHRLIPDGAYWSRYPVHPERKKLLTWIINTSAIRHWDLDQITAEPLEAILVGPLTIPIFVDCLYAIFMQAARENGPGAIPVTEDSDNWGKLRIGNQYIHYMASNYILMALQVAGRTPELTAVINGALSKILRIYVDGKHLEGLLPPACVKACCMLQKAGQWTLEYGQDVYINAAQESMRAVFANAVSGQAERYFEGVNPFTALYTAVWRKGAEEEEEKARGGGGGGGGGGGDEE